MPFKNKFVILYRHSDGSIAQLGEHLPYKQGVTGSSPVVPTICGNGSVVERHLAKVNVASSNLVSRSTLALAYSKRFFHTCIFTLDIFGKRGFGKIFQSPFLLIVLVFKTVATSTTSICASDFYTI